MAWFWREKTKTQQSAYDWTAGGSLRMSTSVPFQELGEMLHSIAAAFIEARAPLRMITAERITELRVDYVYTAVRMLHTYRDQMALEQFAETIRNLGVTALELIEQGEVRIGAVAMREVNSYANPWWETYPDPEGVFRGLMGHLSAAFLRIHTDLPADYEAIVLPDRPELR
ncbi:hypothetical protein AGRA3207_007304 [Actinomadura graeca]|uniref:Uncharacterized protein n=1 Tax=Actinomadura graeca TaxID=2750812 RepID=A0ABX8R3X2_9ACTN|nr:hypothetical protein [Actinomadura graeca]QXJ25761.1 hypothetical protein AGRA3207_007304 [Actinomadura graeca]